MTTYRDVLETAKRDLAEYESDGQVCPNVLSGYLAGWIAQAIDDGNVSSLKLLMREKRCSRSTTPLNSTARPA